MHAEGLSCTYHRSTNFGVNRGTYKKTNSQTPLKAMPLPRGQLKQLIAQCGTFVTQCKKRYSGELTLLNAVKLIFTSACWLLHISCSAHGVTENHLRYVVGRQTVCTYIGLNVE